MKNDPYGLPVDPKTGDYLPVVGTGAINNLIVVTHEMGKTEGERK